ncbi:MAG: hypothetical protein R3263_06705 [Myxococcota bacterium]|nr:hypothetical protein [Myxococcota bacterium]
METGDARRGFLTRLRAASIDAEELATWLDGLTHVERVQAVRGAGRAEQRRLYEAVGGFRRVGLADLVPADRPSLAGVRHYGKNTLGAFTHFEKRFTRPEGEDPAAPKVLWGYNHQSLAWLTGPGWFVAREDPERGEVLIDYREVPPHTPSGWPAVRRNEVGLSRFVYGHMVDTLRRVSEHVTIGSAARKGRDIGSWFLLCREP